VAQARRLVEAGYAEIVLTGVDLTAYGLDLPGAMRLGGLVRHILRHVPELPRLRLSSIDQVEADAALLDAIAEEPRLMPHLHLSLQSGDDIILKRMKRRHGRAGAIGFCEQVRRLRPDMVFGADLIAGFPTETEEMFANSVRLVDECGLTFLHVFPYSRRAGTPAERMPQVAGATVKERAARLRRRGGAALAGYLDSQVGSDAELLMERRGLGRTRSFVEAEIDPDGTEPGDLLYARVTGSTGSRLRGERLAPKCAP
jgi:threonylcarbamoyladenosine tRNA methylthiotransferase MtaB